MIKDTFGILWSLKFLANSRAAIGIYFDGLLGMETLVERVSNHTNKLNQYYDAYKAGYEGSYCMELDAKDPKTFFLDNRSPWVTLEDVSNLNTIQYEYIKMPSVCVRDYWLSPCVHYFFKFRELGVDDNDLLELLIICGYQTSWLRFTAVCKTIISEGLFSIHPEGSDTTLKRSFIAGYYDISTRLFGITGGGPFPRADPAGIDIKREYLSDSGDTITFMKNFITETLIMVNNCKDENFLNGNFKLGFIRKKLELNEKGYSRLEIGEFRLMLMVQIAVMCKIIIKPSPKLINILYPIEGKGSEQHLTDLNVAKENHASALVRIIDHFGLQEYGCNAAECLLCECLPERKVFDIFPFGVNLYLLDKDGITRIKRFGENFWR